MPRQPNRWLCFLLALVLTLSWGLGHRSQAQPAPNAEQLVEQGVQFYRQGNYQRALQNWQAALERYQTSQNQLAQAIVWENIARAYGRLGQSDPEIAAWHQTLAYYREQQAESKMGQLLTEIAHSHLRLGKAKEAIALLCSTEAIDADVPETACAPGSAIQIAQTHQDRRGLMAALGNLGEAYRLYGRSDRAIVVFKSAQHLSASTQEVNLLNSLGNAYFSQAYRDEQRAYSAGLRGAVQQSQTLLAAASQQFQQAIDYFGRSSQLADDKFLQLQALLGLLQLYYFPRQSTATNIAAGEAIAQQP
ncbi:MAG: hypothetical protein HC890_04745 [Chloroflexaceae bacterium]|nr:hypothetical protein [Chloroflexaceae bacterium]